MLNFTFYSSANAMIIEYNSCIILALCTLLLISFIILGSYFYFKKYQVWLLSLGIMLSLWSIAGLGLYLIEPGNFLSDWISSAAAIGTIGAVITSLYLANRRFGKDKVFIFNLSNYQFQENKSCARDTVCTGKKYFFEGNLNIENTTDIVVNIENISLNGNPNDKQNGTKIEAYEKKEQPLFIETDQSEFECLIVKTSIGSYKVYENSAKLIK
ncbi:hypothetical protein [Aquella oligotrophica]|uniref:Uncharacterized protein n=1 Tax=Aquella oligotrophica TaxID=2067065 RepID=A0A2I7N5I4_9NEIS|nr:hypothetical protein [Aquella oligotrophica]AUR51702.1 hypothetical protein CUN60_05135 [Aquella oligotrophica]